MTESLLPRVLQELRDAILAKVTAEKVRILSVPSLGPYFKAWNQVASEFPHLTGCCAEEDTDPSDDSILARLEDIERIIRAVLDSARERQPARTEPQLAQHILELEHVVGFIAAHKPHADPHCLLCTLADRARSLLAYKPAPVGREAGPLVDAPPCRYCGEFAIAQERLECAERSRSRRD